MSELEFKISLDTEELESKMNEVKGQFSNLSGNVVKRSEEMESSFASLGKTLGKVFTVGAAAGFIREMVNVRAEIQSLEVSFQTLLGSEEKAASLLAEINQYVALTPMDMGPVAKAAQTLLSFNMEAEQIMPTIKALGDISMGNAEKFQSLALAFAQMQSAGKLMGQDLLQMINAGFNPLSVMAEQTGKSIGVLKDEMSSGDITSDMVAQAFMDATSEGGKFFGMIESQSKTLSGSFGYLRGTITDLFNNLGKEIEEPLANSVSSLAEFLSDLDRLGRVVSNLVIAFGAYKAAIIASSISTKVAAEAVKGYTISQQLWLKANILLEASQKRLNALLLANPYAIAAAGIVAMVGGMVKLAKHNKEVAESNNLLETSIRKANASSESEIAKLNILFSKLRLAKEGTDEYNDAKNAIMKNYGQYLTKLGDEKTALNDIALAYNTVSKALREMANEKAFSAYVEELTTQFGERQAMSAETIKKNLSIFFGEQQGPDGVKYVESFYHRFLEAIGDIDSETGKLTENAQKKLKDLYKSMMMIGPERKRNAGLAEVITVIAYQSGQALSKLEEDIKEAEKIFGMTRKTAEEPMMEEQPKQQPKLFTEDERKALEERRKEQKKANDEYLAQQSDFLSKYNLMLDESNRTLEETALEGGENRLNKELEQNRINYERKKAQNEELQREMIEDLRKLREAEAKATGEQVDLSSIGVNDLTEEQKRILDNNAREAEIAYINANDRALHQMIEEIGTYSQKREAIEKESAKRIASLYDSEGKMLPGFNEGNIEEIRRQAEEQTAMIDEEYAQRQKTYMQWCSQITNYTLQELERQLLVAESMLKTAEGDSESTDEELAEARARVNTLRKSIANFRVDETPTQGAVEKWNDLSHSLANATNEFREMGYAIGGTVGEILDSISVISQATIKIIDSIVLLTNTSISSIEGASRSASAAIKVAESASLILSIISAAITIGSEVYAIFDDTDEEAARLSGELERLQWKLNNMTQSDVLSNIIDSFGLINEEAESFSNIMENVTMLMTNSTRSSVYDVSEELANIKAQMEVLDQQSADAMNDRKLSVEEKDAILMENEQKKADLILQGLELIKSKVEEIFGGSALNISEQLGDALFDAFSAGTDYAVAWGESVEEIVGNIVKRMLISTYLTPQIEQIMADMAGRWYTDEGQFNGIDAVLESIPGLKERFMAVGGEFEQIVNALDEQLGGMLGDRTATAGSGIAASQDSVNELNGRLTAMQGHTFRILEVTEETLSTVNLILNAVLGIERNTSRMDGRLNNIESNISDIRGAIADMSSNGITIR